MRTQETETYVRLFDHRRCKYSDVVGYCHSTAHKGYVNKALLKKHKCIEKQCTKLGQKRLAYTQDAIVRLSETDSVDSGKRAVQCTRCGNVTYHGEDSRIVAVLQMGRSSWNYRCERCGGLVFKLKEDAG